MRTLSKKKVSTAVIFAVMTVIGIIVIYPCIYSFAASISSRQEFDDAFLIPFSSKPLSNLLHNYTVVFKNPDIIRAFIVTVVRVAYSFVATALSSTLLGFIFAKYRFPCKHLIFIVLISSMMIPSAAMLIPNYIWMSDFPLFGGNDIFGKGGTGLYNNVWYLILPVWVNSYNIFLCRQAFSSLGDEMREAAEIDGASFLRVVYVIYFPLILPVVTVMFLNMFIGLWGDYVNNLYFLPDRPELWTIANVFSEAISAYSDSTGLTESNYPVAFAISFASILPPAVVYALLQKRFTQGLAVGSVKG